MPASHPSSNALTTQSPHRRSIQWTFRTLSLVMGLLLLGLGNAAMALQRGDRGNEVTALQTRLAELNCYSSEVTGVFGPKTEEGVKLCQTQLGIPSDGIAGPQTMAALNGNPIAPISQSPQPTSREILIQKGDRGENVTELQQRLQSLGYAVGGVDGVYGEMTAAAVRDFQQSHGLTPVDGKVSPTEVAKLEASTQSPIALPPAQPSNDIMSLGPLSPGMKTKDVVYLQQRLKARGYFNAEPVASYGPVTTAAVERFQSDNGIQPTGVADTQTLQALGLRGGVTSLPPTTYYKPPSGPFVSAPFTTNNRPYDRPATPNARYVVVIPKENGETLGRVRQVVGGAQAYSSNKGDYIAAGSFAKRSDAEKRSQNLRAYGLDARVDYQ
jgi:peptidoglycan hydrolase-like protein with peptidoglycan-binding domain